MIRVLNMIEHDRADAGSIGTLLAGQADALRRCDVEVTTVSADVVGGASWADRMGAADVLHVYGWGYPPARQAVVQARKSGMPYLITPLGRLCENPHQRRGWGDRFRRLGERSLIRGAAAVTAINRREHQELCARQVCDDIRLLDVGVSASRVAEAAKGSGGSGAAGRSRLVILAPIHPEEGHVAFLKALAELGDRVERFDVVVAGGDADGWRSSLEAAVRRKGGADRVSFVDAGDLATQVECVAGAALIAAPGMVVRLPSSVLLGLGLGVPVLATICVCPDDLQDVVFTCAPTRSEFRRTLEAFLDATPDDLTARVQGGRDVIAARFDWPVAARGYADLYQHASVLNSI